MALTDSLISAWELDEASGNALDSHGDNTLTDTNTVGSGTGHVHGTARDFEFDNSEVFTIASEADLQIADNDAEFEAWVNLESKTANRTILSKFGVNGGGTDWEHQLYYDSGSDRFAFLATTTTPSTVVVTATTFGSPSLATWYQVRAGHDSVSNQIWIRVNNGTKNTAAFSGGINANTAQFRIGSRQFGGGDTFFDGLIGPVRYWKGRNLSDDEGTELYNAGAGLAYDDFDGAPAAGNRRRRLLICGVAA